MRRQVIRRSMWERTETQLEQRERLAYSFSSPRATTLTGDNRFTIILGSCIETEERILSTSYIRGVMVGSYIRLRKDRERITLCMPSFRSTNA